MPAGSENDPITLDSDDEVAETEPARSKRADDDGPVPKRQKTATDSTADTAAGPANAAGSLDAGAALLLSFSKARPAPEPAEPAEPAEDRANPPNPLSVPSFARPTTSGSLEHPAMTHRPPPAPPTLHAASPPAFFATSGSPSSAATAAGWPARSEATPTIARNRPLTRGGTVLDFGPDDEFTHGAGPSLPRQKSRRISDQRRVDFAGLDDEAGAPAADAGTPRTKETQPKPAPYYAKFTLEQVKGKIRELEELDEDANYEEINELETHKIFLRAKRHRAKNNPEMTPAEVARRTLVIMKDICATELSSTFKPNFDVGRYVRSVVENIGGWKHDKGSSGTLFAGGATQSGKSAFKSVLILIAKHFGLPVIIVTKGVGESKDLTQKLSEQIDSASEEQSLAELKGDLGVGTPVDLQYVRSVSARDGKKHAFTLEDCLKAGGVIVSAESASQVNKVANAVRILREEDPDFAFVLVFDEADDYIRRPPGAYDRIQLERAHERIRGLKPALELNVSATLLPLMATAIEQDVDIQPNQVHMTLTNNYVGLLDAVPLTDANGDCAFLQHGELTSKDAYINGKVIKLYEHAIAYGKGALLLDISSPRVTAAGNIFDKGATLRRDCPKLANMCMVAMSASEIRVLSPKSGTWSSPFWGDKARFGSIAAVLAELDDDRPGNDHYVGIGVPIAVIGYSKMERCVSFRTKHRVPTHLLEAITKGFSVDRLVQTLGRLTHLFPPEHVKGSDGQKRPVVVLANGPDWDTARAYVRFQKKAIELMSTTGKTFQDVLANHVFDDCENFRNMSQRPVGNKKAERDEHLQFKHKPFEPDGEHRKGYRYSLLQMIGSDLLHGVDLFKIASTRSRLPATRWAFVDEYVALLQAHYIDAHEAAITAGEASEDGEPTSVSKRLVASSLAQLVRLGIFKKIPDGGRGSLTLYGMGAVTAP